MTRVDSPPVLVRTSVLSAWDWMLTLSSPARILTRPEPSLDWMLIPPLHGALQKNEQDVHLFERLAFLSRREGARPGT